MPEKITLVQSGKWTEGANSNKAIAFGDEEDAWRYCLRHYDIKNPEKGHLDRVNRQKIKNFRGVFRMNKGWVLLTEIKFFPKKRK